MSLVESSTRHEGKHAIIVGPPGSGKTCLASSFAESYGGYLALLDPKGDLGERYAVYCANRNIDFVLDDLANRDHVLGRELFVPQSGGSYEEELEADRGIEAFLELMLFRRGFSNAFDHPYLEVALRFVAMLVIFCIRPIGVRKVRNALRLWHKDSRELVQNCWHPDVQAMHAEMSSWSKIEKERVLSPAQRILDSVFGNPAVRERLSGNYSVFDCRRHIVKGSASIANEANRAICGFDLINAILIGMLLPHRTLTSDFSIRAAHNDFDATRL